MRRGRKGKWVGCKGKGWDVKWREVMGVGRWVRYNEKRKGG